VATTEATNTAVGPSLRLHGTPFGAFVERRRAEHAAKGAEVPLLALMSEWRRLPAADREEFGRLGGGDRGGGASAGWRQQLQEQSRAPGRGVAGAGASHVAKALRQQLVEQSKKPRPKHLDEQAAKRGRKSAKDDPRPVLREVPRPVFPSHRAALEDRARQRRQSATALRAQAEGRGAEVSVASSSGVNLTDLSACLSGPTLSFDWQDADAWSESDGSGDGLEVDVPAEAEEARGLLERELRHKISSAQVQSLAQRQQRGPHAAA